MGNLAICIQVGGEYHSVQTSDAIFAPERTVLYRVGNLTEQCDYCGAGGQDSTYSVIKDLSRPLGVSGYKCDGCGGEYRLHRELTRDVVWAA